MSRFEKIASAVAQAVSIRELSMLNDGCLSHVGDIVEAGAKDILVDGKKRPIKGIYAYGKDHAYKAIPSTITVNGVELVPPVTELEEGEVYWLCNLVEPDLPSSLYEENHPHVQRELERRFIFTTKDAAALYTNHVLLAAHKKLIESGEI